MTQPAFKPAPVPAEPTIPRDLPRYPGQVTGPIKTPEAANDNPNPREATPPDQNPKKNTIGRYLTRAGVYIAKRFPWLAAAGGATAVTSVTASEIAVSRMNAAANRALHDSLGLPGPAPMYSPFLGLPLKPQLSLTNPDPPPAPQTDPATNVRVRSEAVKEKKRKGSELIQNGDFSPASNPAKQAPALWSGGEPAMKAAHAAGYGTMESTAGGKALQDYVKSSGLEWEDSKQLWKRASAKYAGEVAKHYGPGGEVPAFVRGNNPGSILNTVEEPIVNGMGGRVVRFPGL